MPRKKPASPGLWSALRQFFGGDQRQSSSPKIKPPRKPRKRKTAAERDADREQAQQALPDVLENTTLTNAKAISKALQGIKQATQSAGPQASPSPASQPQPQPGGSRDPWGGRGTQRRFNFGKPLQQISGAQADAQLPPQAPAMQQDTEFRVDPRVERAKNVTLRWMDAVAMAFRKLAGTLGGSKVAAEAEQGGGGTPGGQRGGGKKGGSRLQSVLQLIQRVSSGAQPIAGGAGAGGAGYANAASGAAARGGMGLLRGAAALGGRAAMAAGVAGAVVAAPIALAAAFIKLRQVATDFAEAQAESTRAFVPFNAKIAAAFGKSQFEDKKRMWAQGAMNQESSTKLIEAVDKMKNESLPLRAAVTELLNNTASVAVGMLRSINGLLKNLPGMKEYLKNLEEQGKKKGDANRQQMTSFFKDVTNGTYNKKPE